MASMSLEYILCDPEPAQAQAPHTRSQRREKTINSSAAFKVAYEGALPAEPKDHHDVARRHNKGSSRSKSGKPTAALDRHEHVRQLQNQRQRRYRERKKSSASALQASAEQLHQENGELETAILKHFNSQL